MSGILAINNASSSISRRPMWDKAINFANIVCSRESTYRACLDITAFDIPVMGADIFRGIKKFLESALECGMGTLSVITAPIVTGFVAKVLGKFILPKEMQKNILNYLKFSMNELDNLETFKKGVDRIAHEEVEDREFIASLYKRNNDTEKVNRYQGEAEEIKSFCSSFTPTEESLQLIKKLKKATIIGESFIEGGWWGSGGLLIRLFRKYVLGEDRFTGTKGYVSDAESAELGESGDLTTFQKIVGVGSVFLSPIVNLFSLHKIEDKEKVEKSPFLRGLKDQLDMTHGVFPKLGLLFSYTTLPKWIGTITLAQGWYERSERVLKLFSVVLSWWIGHRFTNGLLAKKADSELAEKYKVDKGILIEPNDLKVNPSENFFLRMCKKFPEPAKIHHVFKSVESNTTLDEETKTKLKAEAEEKHAKCLYIGFTLHSLGVFLINLIVNQITKFSALFALGR